MFLLSRENKNYETVYLTWLKAGFFLGEQGWRSGESARDSQTRRHMWVEFVVGSRPCSEGFFSGFSGFPPSSKINTSKF